MKKSHASERAIFQCEKNNSNISSNKNDNMNNNDDNDNDNDIAPRRLFACPL